jgi:hypothetical protein
MKGRVLSAVFACALLGSCGDAPTPQAQKAAPDASPAKPKTAALASDMVAAVSAGKGTPAVSVHFALGATPAVGMALPVKIAIVPRRPFSTLQAHFEAQDGLVMSEGEDFPPQQTVEPEKVLDHQLMLQPTREGVLMVTVAVETESDEGSVTRIYSIPLIVHGAKPPADSVKAPPAPAPASTG